MTAASTIEIPIHGGGVALVDDRPEVIAVTSGRTWHRDGRGYLVGSVRGKTVKLHREIWLAVHGSVPEQLDHVNRRRFDNRVCNLRPASASLNLRNRSKWQGDLPTGVEHAGEVKYRSRVSVCNEMVSLGTFPTAEDAALAYRIAADCLIAIEAARSASGLPAASNDPVPPARTPERRAWAAAWRERLTAPVVVTVRPDQAVSVKQLEMFTTTQETHA